MAPRTDDEIRRAVVDQLRTVELPGGDPIAEGIIETVRADDGIVTLTVAFDRLDQRTAERVADQLRGAGLSTAGVDHVRLEAVDAAAPASGLAITGVDSVLAVASAKGGVGKTTVTAGLARALHAAGLDVAVFDANVYAPDLPDLLGVTGPVPQTPAGRLQPVDADGIEVVSLELIADDGPTAWRGAMVHDVLTDLVEDAAWDDRDVLLVDLPPGIGDAVYTIVQQAPLDGGLLVTTPTDAAVRAAERTGALFAANDVDTIVVPNMVATDADRGPFDDWDGAPRIDAAATAAPVPFDPSLREPTARSFADPTTPGARAIAALGETVASFREERAGPQPLADAIDLRGLPPAARRRQAMGELGRETAITLRLRHDPSALVADVEAALERGDRRLAETTATDLGRDGWRLDLAAEPAEPPVLE
ncbi:ParA/MinD ATPase-like protein [Halovivax asiaticus JCM 14624]|uniref:ParA/MinD ATPase-like protein n=1 Tax=Halovivax asiaticus JCM 14624 TaxID=1227490 RepID=M0BIG5_9EURY|nr:P-loop NTPase [Halovivax asiaticus]ELZ10078.1 ParA/MinD ATPase-like protein [Halovivax asiaticus JCM 14624]